MDTRRFRVPMCLMALCFTAISGMAAGADTEWNRTDSGDHSWFDSGNWTAGEPGSTSAVHVPSGVVVVKSKTVAARYDSLDLSSDARLFIVSHFSGNTFTNAGQVYVLGSGASIETGSLSHTETGATHFFLDSNGSSPILLGSENGLVLGSTPTIIGAVGFTAINYTWSGMFTLYQSDDELPEPPTIAGDAPFESKKVATASGTEIGAVFSDDLEEWHWNLEDTLSFDSSDSESTGGWRQIGDIPGRTSGEAFATGATDLLAEFLLDNLGTADLAALKNYLESGLPSSWNIDFDDFDSTGKATVTVASGYNVFGWGLTAFNEMYGADVRLTRLSAKGSDSLAVPEPATWLLLLLSGLGLALVRRRQK